MLNAVQDKTTLDKMFDFLVLIPSLGDTIDTNTPTLMWQGKIG